MFRGEGRRGKQGGQVNDTASFCDILHRIATIAATHTHTHNHPPATKRMDQLYVGTSNTLFTDAESAEAVRLYNQLPTDWSANRRHEHVAKQMTYDTRNVHRKQIARALERHTSSGGITAMCRRQLKRKVRAIAPQKKRKSRRAVPLNTKVAIVEMVLRSCVLTAPEIRSELYDDGHGLWSSETVNKVRRDAGFTRKRTTPAKREACPVAQHQHAESLIQLGYLPEHFIFIGATDRPIAAPCPHPIVAAAGLTADARGCMQTKHTRHQKTGTRSTGTPPPAARPASKWRARSTCRSPRWRR